jgi:hypothetical protein
VLRNLWRAAPAGQFRYVDPFDESCRFSDASVAGVWAPPGTADCSLDRHPPPNGRYLRLYTNPPDDIAAGYVEEF